MASKVRTASRMDEHAAQALRDAAWSQYVSEYTSAIDDDPGDARTRYLETINRIQAMENGNV